MAYLENVGRSILTWELAATGTCRRNEETGSQSKGKGVWNFWERRTGWGIQAWVLGGDILRVPFPEGLPAPLSTWRNRTCTFWGLKNSPWTPDICCCLLLAFWPRSCKRSFTSSPQPLWPSFHLSYAPSLKLGHQLGWDSSLFFSSYEIYTLSTYLNYICVCVCIIYKTIYKYTHTYIHFISQAL